MCSWIKYLPICNRPPDLMAAWRKELTSAHHALQLAYNHFDQVTENDLVDASTYELYAAELRYNWLFGQVRAHWNEQAKEGRRYDGS